MKGPLTMNQPHWAVALIGLPYRRGAQGPREFSCWGLVRHVFAVRWQIEMPIVNTDDPSADNVAAIKGAARVSGWSPTGDRAPADGDIVMMSSIDGPHVGVMIEVDGALRLLHAFEGAGVCTQSLAEADLAGFCGFVFWRHAA